jgi:hypothetical protein
MSLVAAFERVNVSKLAEYVSVVGLFLSMEQGGGKRLHYTKSGNSPLRTPWDSTHFVLE